MTTTEPKTTTEQTKKSKKTSSDPELHRPLVEVQLSSEKTKLPMPAIFSAPIRTDIVQFIHQARCLNSRSPHAQKMTAGKNFSAHSWGTGRAVSRIPRVSGGGTHRSGQGAFGNMCRSGRLYGGSKLWRRWHKSLNLKQRRYAVISAIAATSVTPLVMARGHKIDDVPEIPLVVANAIIDKIQKTKDAVQLLKDLGVWADCERVKGAKNVRPGKGKRRNRKWKTRRGPVIIYKQAGSKVRSFRNIYGMEIESVDTLPITILAPGGQVGRLVIWTEDAFAALDDVYGTFRKTAVGNNRKLPYPMLRNPGIRKVIKSREVQAAVRDPIRTDRFVKNSKPNPYAKKEAMARLNPYYEEELKQIKQRRAQDLERRRKGLVGVDQVDRNDPEYAAYFTVVNDTPLHPERPEEKDREVMGQTSDDEDEDGDEDLLDL